MSRWAYRSASPAELHGLIAIVLGDGGDGRGSASDDAVQVRPDALGFGKARARVGTDPAAVARDDISGHRELAVGVIDRVSHMTELRDRAGSSF